MTLEAQQQRAYRAAVDANGEFREARTGRHWAGR
jgi:hypothetical protein